jgi:hypothetical protein
MKEWLEVPAYLRKDIQLQPMEPLPGQEITRYQLEDTLEEKDEQQDAK